MRKFFITLALLAVLFASQTVVASAKTVIVDAGEWHYGTTGLFGGGEVYSEYEVIDGQAWGRGYVKNARGVWDYGSWVTYGYTSYSRETAYSNETDYAFYARKSG